MYRIFNHKERRDHLDFNPNRSRVGVRTRHKIFFLRSADRLVRLGETETHIKHITVLEVRVE